jgi:hypothetical protein
MNPIHDRFRHIIRIVLKSGEVWPSLETKNFEIFEDLRKLKTSKNFKIPICSRFGGYLYQSLFSMTILEISATLLKSLEIQSGREILFFLTSGSSATTITCLKNSSTTFAGCFSAASSL